MTCIVGVEHPGGVIIGGDSAGVAGYDIRLRADAKVFRNGAYLLGFTRSFRMGQLLRYNLTAPPPPERALDRFMSTTFINAVRDCLAEGGFARRRDEREEGGTFLVGARGRLYLIDSDFQVGRTLHGYDAIGCGSDLAVGALHATAERPPRARVLGALKAAAAHSGGVAAPFTILGVKA